jgi:hypothetical protein
MEPDSRSVTGKEALAMRRSRPGSFREQVGFLRRQFLQDGDLPFTDVLTEAALTEALAAVSGWLDRVFSPLVTLWVFLGQVLSADHSCRAAVARLIAHRVGRGQRPCSAQTGAYCQARRRLPESFIADVARHAGRALERNVDPQWLWKGRRVYVYDGSAVSMPDTPANQRDYPQPDTQKPGLGFPLARLAAVFSLACGAVLDLGICRYAGKGQSELGMLRALWDRFRPGDVVLGDRLLCAWTEMVMLKQRGIDCVCRLTSHRAADFRRGRRLGRGDHVVAWPKPNRPRSLGQEAYGRLPESLAVRETRVRVEQAGFRTKVLVIATTLLDAGAFPRDDLARLYRARWNAELDLRSLKRTLQMDVLRCKSPAMVRKEIWAHVLAYNLIRTVMAQAAAAYGLAPRSISFKGTAQTLQAFQPVLARGGGARPATRGHIYQQLLAAVATHHVADRPDRFEPRLRKRRPKHYAFLRKPRHEVKRQMAKRVSKI